MLAHPVHALRRDVVGLLGPFTGSSAMAPYRSGAALWVAGQQPGTRPERMLAVC